MNVRHHIAFSSKKNSDFLIYLLENGVSVSQEGTFSSFDILENAPQWTYIQKYISENGIFSHAETLFTKTELQNAQYLTVRSKWRCGYPQPENSFSYQSITYSNQHLCPICGSGLTQTASFRIKKLPNWGSRHFMMLNWVEDELFLDDTAAEVLSQSGLRGFSLRDVLNKTGSMSLLNVHQLDIPFVLPAGLHLASPALDQIFYCENCGIPKYHPTGMGMLSFSGKIFSGAPDIMKTSEIFGWGHSASKKIIVRQSLYQLLTQNKLDKGLVFEPIQLI